MKSTALATVVLLWIVLPLCAQDMKVTSGCVAAEVGDLSGVDAYRFGKKSTD